MALFEKAPTSTLRRNFYPTALIARPTFFIQIQISRNVNVGAAAILDRRQRPGPSDRP